MNVQNVNPMLSAPIGLYSQVAPKNCEVKLNKENEVKPKKLSLVDKFSTSVKNSCDMEDTVTVPRTIFKGYLGFMAGSMLGTIGSFFKKGKMKSVTGIASTLLMIYGTWSFVRPYVIKNSQKK